MANEVSYKDAAIKKLSEKPKSLSRYAQAVSGATIEQLKSFCRQNNEFAQAVVQSKGTVAECLERSVKGCKDYSSDFSVFSKAVDFWFPGAIISYDIKLDIGDGGFSNEPEEKAPEVQQEQPRQPKRRIVLSLDELL